MQVWLRLLIVWFVALALPVQGMASVTMAPCGPGHERMGSTLEGSDDHLSGPEAGVAHHQGEAVSDADDQADQVATSWNPQQGKFADLAKQKCSSCASCCAGTALLGVMPGVPKPPSAPAVFAEQIVVVDAFASGGPDRPPRA